LCLKEIASKKSHHIVVRTCMAPINYT